MKEDFIMHKQGGKEGMKWGYNDGKPNGKRKAGEDKIKTPSEADYPKDYKNLKLNDEIAIELQAAGKRVIDGILIVPMYLGEGVNNYNKLLFNKNNSNKSDILNEYNKQLNSWKRDKKDSKKTGPRVYKNYSK